MRATSGTDHLLQMSVPFPRRFENDHDPVWPPSPYLVDFVIPPPRRRQHSKAGASLDFGDGTRTSRRH